MRVKRYVVDSMPDALQRIRSDLGKDAVILNTKEIKSGGFLGMFAKRKIEVVAATDSADGSGNRKTKSTFPEGRSVTSAPLLATARPPAADPSLNSARPHAVAVMERQEEENRQQSSGKTQDVTNRKQTQQHGVKNDLSIFSQEDLLKEVRQMKKIMLKIMGERDPDLLPDALEKWKERLLRHEFSPELAERIVSAALEGQDRESWSVEDAAPLIRDQLLGILLRRPVHEIAEDANIVHFVGPTGVGKTTTIAKLAAHHALKLNRNIGFITADTYRIAAVEQLRTYANILNVPLEVVNAPQDLVKSFERLQDKDIIFMDTAGRNFRNEMYVSELNSLLQSKGKSETYLVLSLTMKYRDMKAVAENFIRFQIDKVLFTKLDETDSYGPIFNLLDDYDLRLSYMTDGQNVPEDISKANAEKLIDLIMEDSTDE